MTVGWLVLLVYVWYAIILPPSEMCHNTALNFISESKQKNVN